MKNKNIWLDDDFEKLKSVNTDLETDVLIIGGGITGISILYQLNKNNIKALLVEKNICGSGVTSKSTAKITYLQEKIYMNIRKLESDKIARKYLHSQTDAVKILADIIKNENIKCDLKRVDSILFSNCKNNYKKIEDEYNFLINSNIKAKIENFSELNNAFGLFRLGWLYKEGMGVKADRSTALTYLEKAMAAGSTDAIATMAALYEESGNYSKALTLLEEGANKQNATAMFQLSDMYLRGLGVKQNFLQAKVWEGKAMTTEMHILSGYNSLETKAKEIYNQLAK